MQSIYFLCGVLISRGAVFGQLSPFGAAYVASVPYRNLITSMLGTIFGYVVLDPENCFRYIAIVVAIGAIRFVANDIKNISKSTAFPSMVAFLPVFATGIALLFSDTSQLSSFALCTVEALISASGAFFLDRAICLCSSRRNLTSFTQQELSCIVMSGCILLLALAGGTFLSGGKAYAQQTLVDVRVDSAAILIGEQTVLHLTVTTDKDKAVQLVIPRDTLMAGVEVLEIPKADSTLIENDRLLIKQDLLVTSFDSSLYLLPPFMVIDGADTVYSNQVALKVSTVPVNADKPEEFYDIKSVWKPPFVLADYYPWIFGVLLTLFLICVVAYVIKRMRNRQSILPFKKPEPKLPPHEQAIKELDEIKQQKLWQQGRSKEYYTLITDTLRRYIVDRFGINAMEMTSGEILDIIRKQQEATSVYESLKQIMQLADFVKFAKMNPLPDENDLSLMNAYLFINQTKVEEIPVPGEGEKAEGEEKSVEKNDSNISKE